MIILLLWVGVILLSSTSWVGGALDQAFSHFFATHLRHFDKYDVYHEYHVHFLAEKNFHVLIFVVLAILLWRILPDSPNKAGLVFLSGAVIGCCSELAQCLFPGRDPTVRDALLNMVGTGIGTIFNFSRPKLSAGSGIRLPFHSRRQSP
jgi:VanZ family protein